MRKFAEIVARVEQVREHFGMTKSRFSEVIGMRAQTYNCFIGTKGSKPNIELLHGVVEHLCVHPLWLLTGNGRMFQFEPQEEIFEPTISREPSRNFPQLRERERVCPRDVLRGVRADNSIENKPPGPSEGEREELAQRIGQAIGFYLARCPSEAVVDINDLLSKIGRYLGNARTLN